MAPAAAAPQQIPANILAQILGRNQGPELFFQQPFAALQSPTIPKNINLNRPLERLHIVWRGNVTVAVANLAVVASEAPQTIIQRIVLTGTHSRFSRLAPLDVTGSSIFAYSRLFRTRTSSLYINGVRQAEPNMPFQQIGATFGNIGSYDLEIHYDIPLVPILPTASEIAIVPFLLQEDDWGDTLQLKLYFGDATSFGTPGAGTTVTFGAFGTPGVGDPLVSIYTNYEILGPLAKSVPRGVLIRNSQTITGGVTAIAQRVRLQILQKQKTTNVLVKSGLLLAGTSGAVSVFGNATGGLKDNMLDLTQIVVDNKPVRDTADNFSAKEYGGYVFDTVQPQGYLNFTFVDSMSPLTFYRGDLVSSGASFELDTNILTAGATQAVEVMQEQVLGDPQGAS